MVTGPGVVNVTGEVTAPPPIVNPLDTTPTLSVAVIDSVTGVPAGTSAPLAGEVIVTCGGVDQERH